MYYIIYSLLGIYYLFGSIFFIYKDYSTVKNEKFKKYSFLDNDENNNEILYNLLEEDELSENDNV